MPVAPGLIQARYKNDGNPAVASTWPWRLPGSGKNTKNGEKNDAKTGGKKR